MFDVAIIHIYEVRVQAMRLIGENLLNILLLILISIAQISYLLRISYVLMSPYRGGTDRVFIVNFGFSNVCVNGQEDGKWGGDP